PTEETMKSYVANAGFDIVMMQHYERPTPLIGEDRLRQWLEMFGNNMFKHLTTEEKEAMYTKCEDILRPKLYKERTWTLDYWRLRFIAKKKRECKLNCVCRSAYGSCFAVQFFCCKIKYNYWEIILLVKSTRVQKSAELAKQILENYQPENVEDMQDALKDIFGPMFETMLKGEMNHHLGYESNDKKEKETDNRRNGYGKKTVKTSSGTL